VKLPTNSTKRAKQQQAAPLLKYERHSTAPSAKPVRKLVVILALLFFALVLAVEVFEVGQTFECRRD